SSRRRHTRFSRDWSSDVCSSDLRRGDVPWRRGGGILASANLHSPCPRRSPERERARGAVAGSRLCDGCAGFGAGGRKKPDGTMQIGRASCRERREGKGVGGRVGL